MSELYTFQDSNQNKTEAAHLVLYKNICNITVQNQSESTNSNENTDGVDSDWLSQKGINCSKYVSGILERGILPATSFSLNQLSLIASTEFDSETFIHEEQVNLEETMMQQHLKVLSYNQQKMLWNEQIISVLNSKFSDMKVTSTLVTITYVTIIYFMGTLLSTKVKEQIMIVLASFQIIFKVIHYSNSSLRHIGETVFRESKY